MFLVKKQEIQNRLVNMSIIFRYGRHGYGKRDRCYKKYPRHLIDTPNKVISHTDINYKHIYGNLKRFLLARINKPINKVYSEFLKHCDKSVKNYGNIKNWFYKSIEYPYGVDVFYIEDGILKHKTRILAKYRHPRDINNDTFKHIDFNNIVKNLLDSNIPQYVGKFYIDYSYTQIGPQPVYLDICSNSNPRLTSKKYREVSINGYIRVILDVKTNTYIPTMTSLVFNKPYFHFIITV